MENKSKNVAQNWGKGTQKGAGLGGQGQIDEVIGDFGKYQFLIFIFKILIG